LSGGEPDGGLIFRGEFFEFSEPYATGLKVYVYNFRGILLVSINKCEIML
jgi:hypothetical protein